MSQLNAAEIAELGDALAKRRATLDAEVKSKLAEARDERVSFETSIATDGGDSASLDASGDLHRAEVARDITELEDIEAAQLRIADGTFGTCTDCGEFIGIQRLRAWPSAKRCMACQRNQEPHGASRSTL